MITTANKQRILEAIATNRANYPSDAKHAAALGISASVYNSLKKGQTDKALSDANWVNIARRLDVNLRDSIEWKGARTATFDYITTQLEACQERSLSVILCDLPNIGKTYTARWYVNEHRNAVYIDCSQVKTKRALVKKIANEFGVGATGKYQDTYEDLVYYLRSMERPLVVLDEAGDLAYEAFLELKALWNATEMCCGWYMMEPTDWQPRSTATWKARRWVTLRSSHVTAASTAVSLRTRKTTARRSCWSRRELLPV